MEVGTEVWIKPKASKKHSKDTVWAHATVQSKEPIDDSNEQVVLVNSKGDTVTYKLIKGTVETDEIKPMNSAKDTENVENLIDLPYLNEPEILSNLSNRYGKHQIYTYTGAILIAINPFDVIIPDPSCETLMYSFTRRIKNAAVSAAVALKGSQPIKDSSNNSSNDNNSSNKQQQATRHSILISGESGSGKSECSKNLMRFLIDLKSSEEVDDEDSDDDFGDFKLKIGGGESAKTSSAAAAVAAAADAETAASPAIPHGAARKSISFYRAFQMSTMEKIKQAGPLLEAIGNARTAHTYNSSRVGKFFELSFTPNGDLVGGSISHYLLENVRVIKQLSDERNFHIFYQLVAGANEMEQKLYGLGHIEDYHYANQGKCTAAVPQIDDEHSFLVLKESLRGLGFTLEEVSYVMQVTAAILHIGNIEFTSETQLEGQVATIKEKIAGDGSGAARAASIKSSASQKSTAAPIESSETDAATATAAAVSGAKETVLEAIARLCELPVEELNKTLTERKKLLNRELFTLRLNPVQAVNARDAIAKVLYKRLFEWVVAELNKKLIPAQDIAGDVQSTVGILDIFGFDAFTVNSFEQLCINYANEALQQQFNNQLFKLEMEEYTQEGISFENIDFPDNQDSLDLIADGVFKILDDQCRIPNPTDKRFAAALYSNLTKNQKFSADNFEKPLDRFSVEHFAGKVCYTTELFIEKNMDELPQDAFQLLTHSNNPVLSSNLTASSDPDAPPNPPAPLQRRNSAHRNTAPSVVHQFKDETAVMINRINNTVPHYVRCINPLGRDFLQNGNANHESLKRQPSDAGFIGAGATPFDYVAVTEQLRYGGVLEAVRVARSGFPFRMPHHEFYTRFRCLANPQSPITQQLPLTIAHELNNDDVRELCKQLIEALTVTVGEGTRIASLLHLRLQNELYYGNAKRLRLSEWVSNIGGIISKGTVQSGYSKVFLQKAERSMLESCRFHFFTLCQNKILKAMKHRIAAMKRKREGAASFTLLRVARGMLARSRCRRLRRQKAAAALKTAKVDTSKIGPKVEKFKEDDRRIQTEISKLISAKKVSDEESLLRLDMNALKREMQEYAKKFRQGTVFEIKTTEVSELIEPGFMLLLPSKIIPLTTFGKAFSMGRNVKPENRTSSVKYANKSITKDHSMFKSIVKIMDRLRELMELAKIEKDMLDNRRKKLYSSNSSGNNAADKEMAELDVKMHYISKVAAKTRTIYQYYHHYVLQVVKEFGDQSAYKNSFDDANNYLLDFVLKVEEQKPLIDAEKKAFELNGSAGKANNSNNNNNSNGNSLFPLEVPADVQDPRRRGVLPLCAYNEVRFKLTSFAPGVEYTVNALREIIAGQLLMYPIHYIKIVGKTGTFQGRETYYQAARSYASHNLSPLLSLPSTKERYSDDSSEFKQQLSLINSSDFSNIFLTFLLSGAAEVKPENIMVEFSNNSSGNGSSSGSGKEGQVQLLGVCNDEAMSSALFNYEKMSQVPSNSSSSGFNVLFLLPQMNDPVSAEVCSLLTSSVVMPEELVSQWLRELYMQNKRYTALKAVGFDTNDFSNLDVPIKLPPGSAVGLYKRLQTICALLRNAGSDKPVTHADLLAALYPAPAAYYSKLRTGATTVAQLQQVYDQQHTAHVNAELLHDAKATPEAAAMRAKGVLPPAASSPVAAAFSFTIEDAALEFIKAVDFTAFREIEGENTRCAMIYENLSFLPNIWLHKVTEDQLTSMFEQLLQTYETNVAVHSRLNPNRKQIHVPMNVVNKHVVLTGYEDSSEGNKLLSLSDVVRTIRKDLGIRVSMGAAEASRPEAAADQQRPVSSSSKAR